MGLSEIIAPYDFVKLLVDYLTGWFPRDIALGVAFSLFGVLSAVAVKKGGRLLRPLNVLSILFFGFWYVYVTVFKYQSVLLLAVGGFMYLIYEHLPINTRQLYVFQLDNFNVLRTTLVVYVNRVTGLSIALQDPFATIRRVFFNVHVSVRLKGGFSTAFTENFEQNLYFANRAEIRQEQLPADVPVEGVAARAKKFIQNKVAGLPMFFEIDLSSAHMKPSYIFLSELNAFTEAGKVCDGLSTDLATQQLLHSVHTQRDVGARLKDFFAQLDEALGLKQPVKIEPLKTDETEEDHEDEEEAEGVTDEQHEQATAGATKV